MTPTARERPRRALQILHGFSDTVSVYNEYAAALREAGYHLTVLYLFGTDEPQAREKTLADELHFLDLPRERQTLRFRAVRRVISLCREEHFDLVVCHRYKPAQVAALAGLSCPIPRRLFVVHVFGHTRRWSRRLFARLLLRNFTILGVSDAVRDDIISSLTGFPTRQILTLHNAVDVQTLSDRQLDRQQARARLGIPEDAFVFGAVGRLVENKGFLPLVRAFAAARPDLGEARLVIVGSGRMEQRLRAEAAQLGVDDRVTMTGYVPQAAYLMRAFDVFVLSSPREPFGMVLLEAMVASLPVIAVRGGGAPEVLGDCGILTDPADEGALSDALRSLYRATPEMRRIMAQAGRKRAEQVFGEAAFRKRLLDIVAA